MARVRGESITLHWKVLAALLSAVLSMGLTAGAVKTWRGADASIAANEKLDLILQTQSERDLRQDAQLAALGGRVSILEQRTR